MARVVARQKNVPYALIIFVILFVAAAGFAVYFYMNDDGKAATIVNRDSEKAALAENIVELQTEVSTLASLISDADTFVKAMADYELILPDGQEPSAAGYIPPYGYDPTQKLTGNIRQFRQQIDTQTIRGDDLLVRLDVQESKLTGETQEERVLRKNAEDAFREQGDRMVSAQKAQQAERAESERQLRDTRSEYDAIVSRMSRENNSLATDLAEERGKLRDLQKKYDDRELWYVGRYQPDLAQGQKILPDGKISRAVDDRTVYIDLGKGNGVIPDQIFSVYSAVGDDEDGYKAKLVVKQVFEETSECVVTELIDPKNPINAGDIIANIAFDEHRQFTFVVRGPFDVQGGNNPTSDGRDQVMAMIRQFGGKVVDEVDVDVDFVVLGPEPEMPNEPGEDMPGTMREIYETKLREREEYLDVKARSIALRLHILNTNRFLQRIGYVPVKVLTYEEDY